jgi:phthalate 4,5-dioxygenase oxygenase subunit
MANDYLIDREKQKTGEIWTGVRGVRQQDKVVTEGMGPMMNRIHEHLGTSDSMIIHTRKRLLRAVKALTNEGIVPPGVDEPEVYRSRSGSIILPQGTDWLTATEHLRKPQVAVGEPVFASTGV